MQKLLLLPLVFLSAFLFAQPSGYQPGTQVPWIFNGRPHGYFKAAGNGERHILISFTGDGETDTSNYQWQAPQKWLNDNTTNWDGRTVRAAGDTIVWEVFTIPNNSGYWLPNYAADITYFFQHIAAIDTSDHSKIHMEGLSGGVGRMWGFMVNDQGHNSPYRNVFGTTISQSCSYLGVLSQIHQFSPGRRHWVWHGLADENTGTPPIASQGLYDSLQGYKRLTFQAGGTHSGNTWDSCMTLRGTDTNTNRWLWMVATASAPPPVTDTGGPSGYVAGTQVCWTYNGRQHGYFRAAGSGEKHILISFTGDGSADCSNYQTDAPQKWLNDSTTNWDGRTVRGPGDTIRWEVLTIPNNSGYWLPNYASDINYFFQHIMNVDTSDHSKIHMEGLDGGVGRMWGFLVNDQDHNSPYRKVFSTTISQSCTWVGVLPQIRVYSAGTRNWVWYGTADANGNTPPAASVQLYDSLLGVKRITAQAGGTHGASTWDSCMSLAGSDTNSSRWLWMIKTGSGARFAGSGGNVAPPLISNSKAVLFPNPARNAVIIDLPLLPSASAYRLTVTDISGRVHKVIYGIRNNHYQLNISGLSKGIYILQVDGGNYKLRQKLVKE